MLICFLFQNPETKISIINFFFSFILYVGLDTVPLFCVNMFTTRESQGYVFLEIKGSFDPKLGCPKM